MCELKTYHVTYRINGGELRRTPCVIDEDETTTADFATLIAARNFGHARRADEIQVIGSTYVTSLDRAPAGERAESVQRVTAFLDAWTRRGAGLVVANLDPHEGEAILTASDLRVLLEAALELGEREQLDAFDEAEDEKLLELDSDEKWGLDFTAEPSALDQQRGAAWDESVRRDVEG